jgi:Arc/MetJ-type ribon-helix-helix transcriptional regulator
VVAWDGIERRQRFQGPDPSANHAILTDEEVVTIYLNPEQESRIAEALRSGAYSSTDDVIDRALEVLHELDEWLAAKRQAIDNKSRTGIAKLERGEGIPEDELDACNG